MEESLEKTYEIPIEEVSRRTGLKVSTLVDLLEKGWSYVESLGEVRRWDGPEKNLHI